MPWSQTEKSGSGWKWRLCGKGCIQKHWGEDVTFPLLFIFMLIWLYVSRTCLYRLSTQITQQCSLTNNTHRHTQTHTDTHTHKHIQTHTHTQTNRYTHRHSHTDTHTDITQTHIHTYKDTHRHTNKHKHTHTKRDKHIETQINGGKNLEIMLKMCISSKTQGRKQTSSRCLTSQWPYYSQWPKQRLGQTKAMRKLSFQTHWQRLLGVKEDFQGLFWLLWSWYGTEGLTGREQEVYGLKAKTGVGGQTGSGSEPASQVITQVTWLLKPVCRLWGKKVVCGLWYGKMSSTKMPQTPAALRRLCRVTSDYSHTLFILSYVVSFTLNKPSWGRL